MTPKDRGIITVGTYQLLQAVGEDPERDGLQDTPLRVAKMWEERLTGYDVNVADLLRTFSHDGTSTLVIEKDIPFYSTCEHHLLPFHGQAHVGYLPKEGKVAGLSKLARVVDAFAKRLQMQERMTEQIADALVDHLSPDVMVVVEAEHLCMTMRGVQKPGALTVTSAVRGQLKESINARGEFLQLIRR